METEGQNVSLNHQTTGKHRKNYIMKPEINFLLSKLTQVAVMPNPLYYSFVIKWLTKQE